MEEDAKREAARQEYEAQTAETHARIQYQIDYSKTLLNGLMLGNGGAILALLTFIGNTGSKVAPSAMQCAFGFYATGLAFVFIAYIGAFFSQYFFYNGAQAMAWNAQAEALGSEPRYDILTDQKRGTISMGVGVVFCFLSLISFICGSVSALDALT